MYMFRTRGLFHLQVCFYRCINILWCTRVYHTCRHVLYRTCTWYNCLPEDKPWDSKHVHVDDIVKIRIKFSLTKVRVAQWLRHHHHHHWLDSPWWTLAFLRSFAHSSLLRAAFFQLLTPSIRVS